MRHSVSINFALALALVIGLYGCGEAGSPDAAHTEELEQAVTVTPEFSISGTSSLPEELYLNKLGLTISEIRLEPLDPELGSMAYSSRSATRLEFDIHRGEMVKPGEPLELPSDGRYLVSVRLEPSAEVEEKAQGASEEVSSSFSIAGFVAGTGIVRVDPRFDEKRSDGSPVPMPFEEIHRTEDDDDMQDNPAIPTEWTPFHYDSQRSAFITLNEVDFTAGEQHLTFDFDVRDWALELVDPLLTAVEHDDSLGSEHDEGIDVTRPLESTGHGAEALFRNARVQTTY